MTTALMLWLLCAIAGAMIGSTKGRGGTGFVLGFFLGPFGILFCLLMKGNRQTCPSCKSSIHADATICATVSNAHRPSKADREYSAAHVGLKARLIQKAAQNSCFEYQ